MPVAVVAVQPGGVAEQVYAALAPLVDGAATPADGEADRDPTRPFRTPLLAPHTRREPAGGGEPLTEAEFDRIQVDIAALLEAGAGADAVRLLENALERASANPFFALELRRLLGMALFYVGEHRRAAGLLADAGKAYRAGGLASSHPRVVECAYQAGHAYAEIGESAKALAQLRFYVQNADAHDSENADLGAIVKTCG